MPHSSRSNSARPASSAVSKVTPKSQYPAVMKFANAIVRVKPQPNGRWVCHCESRSDRHSYSTAGNMVAHVRVSGKPLIRYKGSPTSTDEVIEWLPSSPSSDADWNSSATPPRDKNASEDQQDEGGAELPDEDFDVQIRSLEKKLAFREKIQKLQESTDGDTEHTSDKAKLAILMEIRDLDDKVDNLKKRKAESQTKQRSISQRRRL